MTTAIVPRPADALAAEQPMAISLAQIRAEIAAYVERYDIAALRELHAKARGVEAFLREQRRERDDGIEIQNQAAEAVLRIERGLGELCAALPKPDNLKRGSARGNNLLPRESLADLGIEKFQSSRWQKLAAISEPEFEEHVRVVRAKGERLTTSGTIRAISEGEGYASDEWFTDPEYVEAAREVMGEIDLDPASCLYAQEHNVRAARFFTREDDGLAQPWQGRLWLNPPYSQPLATQFITKLIEEWESGRVAQVVLLQNASTDTRWFHAVGARGSLCLVKGRLGFYREDGTRRDGNMYAQAFFYLGPEHERFAARFARYGLVGRLRGEAA